MKKTKTYYNMKVIGFAFGIRTVKSFSVEDKLGAIIDEILYSDKSEFNEKLFTEVREITIQNYYLTQKDLINLRLLQGIIFSNIM